MHKTLAIICAVAVAALPVLAELQGYEVFSGTLTSRSTNTVTGTQWITGKPVAVKVDVTAGSTSRVSVVTQSGYGTSIAGAQTLWGITNTVDISSNLASTVYLWKDRITCRVINPYVFTNTVKVLLIVDDEP